MRKTYSLVYSTPLSSPALLGVAKAESINYVNEAVNGLSSNSVYVSPDSSLSSSDSLKSEFSQHKVGIVALPYEATDTLNASMIANSILTSTQGYDTIIVVIDGRSFGVASTKDSVRIQEALYTNYKGDASQAITSSKSIIIGETNTSTGTRPNDDSVSSALLGAGSAVLGLAVIGTIVGFLVKKRLTKTKQLDTRFIDDLPHELQKSLNSLKELSYKYHEIGEFNISNSINDILRHSNELFNRVKKKSGESQYNLATINYSDTFNKLSLALGEDYYLDIHKNPTLWADPEKRMDEVRKALMITDQEIIKNIQQVNANEDLEIKVALEGLTRSMDRPALESIYKN